MSHNVYYVKLYIALGTLTLNVPPLRQSTQRLVDLSNHLPRSIFKRNQTDVLGEDVVGKAVEQAAEHGRETVSAKRVIESPLRVRFADRQAVVGGPGHDH